MFLVPHMYFMGSTGACEKVLMPRAQTTFWASTFFMTTLLRSLEDVFLQLSMKSREDLPTASSHLFVLLTPTCMNKLIFLLLKTRDKILPLIITQLVKLKLRTHVLFKWLIPNDVTDVKGKMQTIGINLEQAVELDFIEIVFLVKSQP